MYKLIYYSDFKDIENVSNRIEIYKDTSLAVTPHELLLTGEPISINYQGEDLYKPLKQSSCTINLYTTDILSDLYSGKLDEIMLKVFKNGALFWYGYITPNVYNSEYNYEYDEMSIEFIDTIAQLDNTKFQKSETASVTTFFDIINRLLNKVDKEKVINTIYFHKVLSINRNYDMLNKLSILERNFFDEKEEPQSNKSVLEDIIKYLGMTMLQYKNSYFIIDYDALANNNFSFIEYNRTTKSSVNKDITQQIKRIADIGVAETNGSISMGNIYNKVNVRAISNTVDNIIPELFDCLTNQNTNVNKYYSETIQEDNTYNTYLSAYFNSCNFNTFPCQSVTITGTTNFDEVTLDNVDNIEAGAFFQKNAKHPAEEEPSSLHWDDVVTMAGAPKDTAYPLKEFKALDTSIEFVMFKNGYFILDFQYLFNNNHHSNMISEDTNSLYRNNKFTTDFHNTMFMCKIMIDDLYYDGEGWKSWTKDYLPHKDLYDNCMFGSEISGSEEKIYYIYNNQKVYITDEEYRKMICKDRFYLVHENKENDPIYNTWKNLTNQVSYKMNLQPSTDGALIPLPKNEVLVGKLTFELYAPNDLSSYANPRTADDTVITKYQSWVRYCHIKDLKLIYTNNSEFNDIFGNSQLEEDTLYSNVIDDNNVQEMDDIELKVNTYNEKVSSYSYVINSIDGKYDYVDKIHNDNYNEELKMEESIIKKNVNRYSIPKLEYQNSLINKDLSPFSLINIMKKKFVINDINYDLKNNKADINAKEI